LHTPKALEEAMDTWLLAVALFVLGGLVVLSIVTMTRLRDLKQRAVTTDTLNQHLEAQSTRLLDSGKSILTQTTTAFAGVQKELGSMQEASSQLLELGRDFRRLEELLQPPKLRGGVGEILLEQVLRQVLPDQHYELQYSFSDGKQVDAAVWIGDSLVPIDAKFPIEAFRRLLEAEGEREKGSARKELRRAIKGHVNAIANKYIKPEEHTYDFALMYIPAENVYYEAVIGDTEGDLLAHALQRHVVPVSPNSFYAYLLVIVHGLRGMQIEQRAAEIARFLEQLRSQVEQFQEDYRVLGTHLHSADSRYGEGGKKLNKIGANLESRAQTISESSATVALEPPSTSDSDNDEQPS
jgi:DNA recombination protein RmuC